MRSRVDETLRRTVAATCAARPVYDWTKVSAARDAAVNGLRELADRLARASTVAEIHALMEHQLGAPTTPKRAA